MADNLETEEEAENWITEADSFGVFRCYFDFLPQRDPLAGQPVEELCDAPGLGEPVHDSDEYSLSSHRSPTGIAWLRHSVEESAADGEDKNESVDDAPDFGPFSNASQFRLTDHFYGRSDVYSLDNFDDLLHVLRSDGFNIADLSNFSARKAEDLLDNYEPPKGVFSASDGWLESSVAISLPKSCSKHKTEEAAPKYSVQGVVHRQLLSIIKTIVEDQNSRFAHKHHWYGHEMYWNPPRSRTHGTPPRLPLPPGSTTIDVRSYTCDEPENPPPAPIRVYTDCYNSNVMLHAEAELRKRPRDPDDAPDVEQVIFPLLFWSDSTHLSSFGSASLWPVYMYFGNLSKYVRGRPTEFAAQHVAYIPEVSSLYPLHFPHYLTLRHTYSQLPDTLKDFYMQEFGQKPMADVLKFCKRELFQQIWLLLLDDEFMQAYEHGMKLLCRDGITCRLFPCIFTYSADYLEKYTIHCTLSTIEAHDCIRVLATALRPQARCPCPHCLIWMTDIAESGSKRDLRWRAKKRQDTENLRRDILDARRYLFQGHALTNARLTSCLDAHSLNPIQVSMRSAHNLARWWELMIL